MLDAELQIVDSQVVDISENANQVSTAGGTTEGVHQLTIGRRGFANDLHFYVIIEAVSADANVDPVKFVLQACPDGTNYIDLATITLFSGPTKLGVYEVPIGIRDFRQELQGASDMILRVDCRYENASGTDDFTYSAYLGSAGPYPSTDAM